MTVQHALLGLLAHQPRHGYELHDAFEAMVGGEANWDVKPAQVYTTLARLEKRGWVAEEGVDQDGGPEKRIYAITAAGKGELKAWFEAPVATDFRRDSFFLKLMLSLLIAEQAEQGANPRQVIYVQRAQLYRELHAVTTQRTQLDPTQELAHVLLMDQVVMHLEADLRWLDMVEARLDEMRRQPMPTPEVRPRGRPARGAG